MIDFKKTQKELYQPKITPSIIDVPEMVFIVADGKGDPNDPSGEYASAIEILGSSLFQVGKRNVA